MNASKQLPGQVNLIHDHCLAHCLFVCSNNVSSMPTFQFFRNKQRLATISGADPNGLEAKIVELIGTGDPAGAGSDSGVPGHMDLNGELWCDT